MTKNKTVILKILVPVLIVGVIIAMFVIKRSGESRNDASDGLKSENTEQIQAVQSDSAEAESGETEEKQTDNASDSDKDTEYPLNLISVDLEKIQAYGVPTVIDFGSDSCIPCKQMAPVLETLNADFQGRAAVQFMDVWKYTDGVQDFPIQVIPTQVFFTAEGKPFEPSEELAAKIPFDQYTYRETGELAFTVHQGGITEEQMRLIFAEMGVE